MTLFPRINRYFSFPHLDDEQLLEELIPKDKGLGRHSRAAHLDKCAFCAERATELELFLDELVETDSISLPAFSASLAANVGETVDVRQNHIMDRVRNASTSLKHTPVLSFPTFKRLSSRRDNGIGWWLSAATAAGLLLGVAVGQFLHFHPEQTMTSLDASLEPQLIASETTRENQPQTPITFTDSLTDSDETFLEEIEVILSNPQIPELSPFDEITPQIREVSINVW
tara:strand:- start:7836 stop:8519 length:684 start_codon:yes stop_codon:yes gene_type:complete